MSPYLKLTLIQCEVIITLIAETVKRRFSFSMLNRLFFWPQYRLLVNQAHQYCNATLSHCIPATAQCCGAIFYGAILSLYLDNLIWSVWGSRITVCCSESIVWKQQLRSLRRHEQCRSESNSLASQARIYPDSNMTAKPSYKSLKYDYKQNTCTSYTDAAS